MGMGAEAAEETPGVRRSQNLTIGLTGEGRETIRETGQNPRDPTSSISAMGTTTMPDKPVMPRVLGDSTNLSVSTSV